MDSGGQAAYSSPSCQHLSVCLCEKGAPDLPIFQVSHFFTDVLIAFYRSPFTERVKGLLSLESCIKENFGSL